MNVSSHTDNSIDHRKTRVLSLNQEVPKGTPALDHRMGRQRLQHAPAPMKSAATEPTDETPKWISQWIALTHSALPSQQRPIGARGPARDFAEQRDGLDGMMIRAETLRSAADHGGEQEGPTAFAVRPVRREEETRGQDVTYRPQRYWCGCPLAVTERVTRPVTSQGAVATSPLAVQLTIPQFLTARPDSAGGLRRNGHQDLHELADRWRSLRARRDARPLVKRLHRCSAASVATWLTTMQQAPESTRTLRRPARKPSPRC